MVESAARTGDGSTADVRAFPRTGSVLTEGPERLGPGWDLGGSNVSKEELVHLDGEVILIAKGGNFRVKLDNGHEVLAKLAGKVRRHRIRVVLGDRVTVAVSPYDPTRGFIVYRQR
jgi:translation initiation factor IF-1